MPQFTIICVLFIFRSMHLARVNRMTSPVNKQFVQCRPFVRLLVFHIANWIKSIRSEINSLDIIRLVVYMGRCWWFFAFERICYCGICNCDLKSVCGGATSLNMRAALILVFMFITTPQLTLCIYCVCLWCLFLPLSYTSITMLSIFIIQNIAFHAGDGSECIHSIKNDHLRQMRTKKKKTPICQSESDHNHHDFRTSWKQKFVKLNLIIGKSTDKHSSSRNFYFSHRFVSNTIVVLMMVDFN